MIATLQLGGLGRAIKRAASGGASYNSLVTTAAPLLWWRMDETSGTTAADSSGGGFSGTLQGGVTFATTNVSNTPPAGYAGLGTGVDFSVASAARIQSANNASLALGGSSSGAWTIVLWMTGSTDASQYVANRQNDQAVIYNFVSGSVEFFASGYTGTDPRTGSAISLPIADTTTPHMIVYRYNNGTYSGLKDGASVFSVSRSFALATGTQHWNLAANDSANESNSRMHDFQLYNRALSDAEIAALYAARNV